MLERISALEAFDVSKMQVPEPPEISGMQVDIKATRKNIRRRYS